MKLVLPLVAALALTACATTTPDSQTAQKPMEEKEFRTGSRIPVRDPVSTSPTTTRDASVMAPGAPVRTN